MAVTKSDKAKTVEATHEPMDTGFPVSPVNSPVVGIGASAGGLTALLKKYF